jgi:hypothetical protein
MNNNTLGLVCIIIGVLIITSGAPFLWSILLTLLALWLINYGLIFRGSPGLMFWVQRMFEELQSIFKSKK